MNANARSVSATRNWPSQKMDEPVLTTERLFIRPWREEEFPFLAGMLSDPDTMVHWPFLYTQDQARSWFDRAAELWRDHGIGRWAVLRKADGAILGDCGLMPSEVGGEAVTDLGYIFHVKHHGQGYATEAARAVLEHGLNSLELTDIVVHMAEDHHASRRVAERLGLVQTGDFVNARNLDKRHLIFRPVG